MGRGRRAKIPFFFAVISRAHITLFTCVSDNNILEQVRVRHFGDTRDWRDEQTIFYSTERHTRKQNFLSTIVLLSLLLQHDVTREKPERGHDGPKPVIAKCCRALLPSDKMDIKYIATYTFLMIYRLLFKAGDDKSIFNSYNRATMTI